MSSSDWLEALEEAQEALRRVIKMAEPGTGIPLHLAYNQLKVVADRERQGTGREQPAAPPQDAAMTFAEARQRWRGLCWAQREQILLEALGDECLTPRELLPRVRRLLNLDYGVYDNNIRALADRMREAGELERHAEQWRGRVRYRYSRRTQLEGPIADLDRVFAEREAN